MNDSERTKTIGFIAIFSILVTVIAFSGPLLGGSPNKPGLGFIVWGTAPLLISLLMRTVTRDWSDLGIKPAVRRNIGWYIFSLLAYPAMLVLAVIGGNLLSVYSMSAFSIGKYIQTSLLALPIFFIFAIFEEVGWRGYLAPKLASLGINRYIGYIVTAVVWTTWHLPYIRELTWVYSPENLVTFIPRYFVLLFALSIVYGEIRTITTTFWPAVLMHTMSNAFGHPLSEYITIAEGKNYLGSVSTGLFIIIFAMLLGIGLNQWRTRKSIAAKSFS